MRVNACPCARECLTSYPQLYVVMPNIIIILIQSLLTPISNYHSLPVCYAFVTDTSLERNFAAFGAPYHSCISDHFTAKEFSRSRTSQLQTASYVYFLRPPLVLACMCLPYFARYLLGNPTGCTGGNMQDQTAGMRRVRKYT